MKLDENLHPTDSSGVCCCLVSSPPTPSLSPHTTRPRCVLPRRKGQPPPPREKPPPLWESLHQQPPGSPQPPLQLLAHAWGQAPGLTAGCSTPKVCSRMSRASLSNSVASLYLFWSLWQHRVGSTDTSAGPAAPQEEPACKALPLRASHGRGSPNEGDPRANPPNPRGRTPRGLGRVS